jgi:hypothetical protein
LTAELAAAKNALLEEKASRSVVDQTLAEEMATRQASKQSLQSSNEAKADLARELESA